MKPSELAKELAELSTGDSEDFKLFELVDQNLPMVLLALRHHEALVSSLQQHVCAADAEDQEIDDLGGFCLSCGTKACAEAMQLLAAIEKEGGA